MDIQKEHEAFEALQGPKIFKIVMFDATKNSYALLDHLSLTSINLSALAEINYGWDMWQAAKAQAVPEGFVLLSKNQIKGYYSHDGENYKVHETMNQARDDALSAIEYYSEQLADGSFHPESNGNFQDIGYGIVLGKSDYSLVRIVTQQDIDDGESKYPVGTEILDLHLNDAMIEAAEGK